MSNLTVKLNNNEDNELDKLKSLFWNKTSSGTIKKLITRYMPLHKANIELERQLEELKSENKDLKKSAQNYFHSMHALMRDCDYEQKL